MISPAVLKRISRCSSVSWKLHARRMEWTEYIHQSCGGLFWNKPIEMSLISYRALHMARVLTSTFSPLISLAREGLRNYRSVSCRRKLCFSNLIRRTMAYSTYDSGAPNSLEYRMYFRKYSQNLKNMDLHSPQASLGENRSNWLDLW